MNQNDEGGAELSAGLGATKNAWAGNPIQSEKTRTAVVRRMSAFAYEHEAVGASVPVWVVDYIAILEKELCQELENHSCLYPNGDGACRWCKRLAELSA
jgi:hypothetical protein